LIPPSGREPQGEFISPHGVDVMLTGQEKGKRDRLLIDLRIRDSDE